MKKIELVTSDKLEHMLAANLMQGKMPDSFLYIGESGVRNWLTLVNSPELPVSAQLQHLFEDSVHSLVHSLSSVRCIVSLGVGQGGKERALLDALAPFAAPDYLAVDVNSKMVDTALAAVADLNVDQLGIVALMEDLPLVREYWHSPVLICLLGNSFCCCEPEGLPGLIYEQLDSGDLLLFDCHLLSSSLLEQNHADGNRSRQNVLFNIRPLIERGMEPDAFIFNLDMIEQETDLGKVYGTCRWLDITKDSTVCCGMSNVHLDAGARVELGLTYKYTREQVFDCLHQHNFDQLLSFTSPDEQCLLVLARKI